MTSGRSKGRRRAIVLVVCAGLTVAIIGAGWMWPSAPAGSTQAGGAVEWAAAAKQSFDVTTLGSGLLEAKQQKEFRNPLEFETSILEIVKEGAVVAEGDTLLKLNTEQAQKQLDSELLQLESARAEVKSTEHNGQIQQDENESALRKATLALELAELDLRKWLEGEVRAKRQSIKQSVDEAEGEVKRLREKVEQNTKLLTQGFLSRDEAQRNQIELHKSETQLDKAKLDGEVFENFEFPREQRNKGSAVEEARAELARTRSKNDSQKASREVELGNKRKLLELRQASVKKLEEAIAGATMKATTGGMVVYATSLLPPWHFSGNGPIAVGRKLYPNEFVLALPDTSELVAKVKVSESVAGKIAPGQQVTLKVDALPGQTSTGVVESVGVLAERGDWDENNREYSVKVLLNKPLHPKLKPSMKCEAEIRVDRAENALAVPLQAVFTEGAVRYVIAKRGGGVQRVPVRVDKRSERHASIAAGLNEGEMVLLRTPTPGEVKQEKWTEQQLASVGLRYGADGVIVPAEEPAGTTEAATPEKKQARKD